MNLSRTAGVMGGARESKKIQGEGERRRRRRSKRVLSLCHPDVLRSFRRRSPADSPVGPSAPPGSHTAPPAKGEDSRGSRFMEGAKRGSRRCGVTRLALCAPMGRGSKGKDVENEMQGG